MWSEFDLVVATEVGTLVDPSNARRTLDRLCDEAGIGHSPTTAQWHFLEDLRRERFGAPGGYPII
jgi:hypothetical protein